MVLRHRVPFITPNAISLGKEFPVVQPRLALMLLLRRFNAGVNATNARYRCSTVPRMRGRRGAEKKKNKASVQAAQSWQSIP